MVIENVFAEFPKLSMYREKKNNTRFDIDLLLYARRASDTFVLQNHSSFLILCRME